ncbi:MAG: hypothetical protein SFY70_04285 [Bacteroidia bacterium]|nr:hypothetical protein [Bacteroidia bacterium]
MKSSALRTWARLCLALGLGLGSAAHGQTALVYQPAFKTLADAGLDHLYNCRFQAAEGTFAQLALNFPQHPGPPFLQALTQWWRIALNTQATAYDAALSRHLTRTIELADALLKQDPENWEAEFLRFSAWGFKARLQALRGNWLTAGNTALKCLPSLKRTEHYKATHPEFLFGSGLYLYFKQWYGEQKPGLKPVLGLFPPGDKAKGLAELRRSVAEPNYTSTEAAQFLTEIYLLAERTPTAALPFAQQLAQRYPGNPFFALWHAKVLYHVGQYGPARDRLAALVAAYNPVAAAHTGPITLAQSVYTTQLMAQVCLYYSLCLQRLTSDYTKGIEFLEAASRMCILNGEADTKAHAQIKFQLGSAADRAGDRATALRHYQYVLEMTQAEGFARLARACKDAPCTYYTPPD